MKQLNTIVYLFFIIITTACTNIYCHQYDYDLIVIGAGASGLTAATIANDLGKKVALIEKNKIGGGRIWSGDIPFKALFKIAETLHSIKNINEFGLNFESKGHLNTEKVLSRVRLIRDKIYSITNNTIAHNKNIDIFFANPKFIDKHTIFIENDTISADKFIIATGSRSFVPPIDGINQIPYLTRENFFDLNILPQSIIILGGGPLGVEMASALNKLGVNVTLVMRHGTLLPTFDFEIVALLTKTLLNEGIKIHCDMITQRASQDNDTITITCADRAHNLHHFHAKSLFIASGGIPNIDGMDLEKADVKITKSGIKVNNSLLANHDNIYACGDVLGLYVLSRIAYYHAKIAVRNMFKQQLQTNCTPCYADISKVVFTQPQLACAGLTEQDAFKIYGKSIHIYRCPYDSLERAHIDQNTVGLAKFICDQNGYLLGIHVFGAYAGEVVDIIPIGKKLSNFFFKETGKIRASPSYFEIIQRVAYESSKDFPDHKKTIFTQIYNSLYKYLFSKKI